MIGGDMRTLLNMGARARARRGRWTRVQPMQSAYESVNGRLNRDVHQDTWVAGTAIRAGVDRLS